MHAKNVAVVLYTKPPRSCANKRVGDSDREQNYIFFNMATVKDDKMNMLNLRAPPTQSFVVTFNVPYTVDLQDCVGKGTFGMVYLGVDVNERKVAIKRVRKLENLMRNNDEGNAIEQDVSYPHVIKIFSVESYRALGGLSWSIAIWATSNNFSRIIKK